LRIAFALIAAWAFMPGTACALSDAAGKDVARAVELRVAKKYDNAAALLRGLAERSATDPEARSEALYQQGLVMQESGRPAEALALFDSVVREYPGQPSAPYAQMEWSLGQARLGAADKAMTGLSVLMSRYPRFGAAGLLAMGDLLEQGGRIGEASMTLRRLINSFPVSPESRQAKTRLADICGKIAGGPPTSATAYAEVIARGECLMDAGDFKGANKLYESALKKNPAPEWRFEVLLAQGRGAVAQEKYGAAEKSFRKAAKAATDPAMAASARMYIVQGHLDRSRLKEAVRELEGIVGDYPGTAQAAQAQLMAGSCYEAMRDRKKAVDAYRRVMSTAPQSPAAAEAQQSLMRVMEAGQ
jgi:TolA-binding protein